MLSTEIVEINGREFIHTFTTDPENKQLLQVDTNTVYDDAMDIADGFSHTYSEIDRRKK